MVDVLKKLNLEALKDKLVSEKLTPDIILKLSLTELKVLGLTDANDIMKLRIRCSIYISNSPQRSVSNFGGAPKLILSKNIFENFIEYDFDKYQLYLVYLNEQFIEEWINLILKRLTLVMLMKTN